MKLTLIRSATLKMEYGGTCFLIDPAFSDKLTGPSFAGKSKNPLVDLPFRKENIMEGVDWVIVSHIHSDHFDKAAQDYIRKDRPVLCQPHEESAIRGMGFAHVVPLEKEMEISGIQLSRTGAKHGSGSVLTEMGVASGFLFKAPGEPSVYWCGDTVLYEEVQKVLNEKNPDIVITHSSGAVWGDNVKILMDEKETIEICKILPQSKVVAVHLNSYDHGTVFRDTLRNFAEENGVLGAQLIIPQDGETLYFN
ncbi:MAG: MBL fold metallo-hydrolase [Clostridia bacterium]|nr:MBL fold metallo-hydrolase [Clostridia bacterium]